MMRLHRSGAELRASAGLAEEILAEGMRLGDGVRRRARGAAGTPPTGEDVAALEGMIRRLDEAVTAAREQPEMVALRRAIADGSTERSAELAEQLYAGLERIAPPEFLFFPMAVRRHTRDLGETLPAPEALVREIQSCLTEGLAAPEDETSLPEPIVGAPTWDAAGSEVALRLSGRDVGTALLRHEASGDLWCFAQRLRGHFTVCLARSADDEWWTASPIPFDRYARRIETLLAEAGLVCERMG